MKVDAHIPLEEFVRLLRDHVRKTGLQPKDITITSYDKPRITIAEDGLVTAEAFSHRSKEDV